MESSRLSASQDGCLHGCKTSSTQGEGAGSFGVKIQVQGIDGRPYVVLNNQGTVTQPFGYPDVFFMDHPHGIAPSPKQFPGSPGNPQRSSKNPSSHLLNYQRHPELLRPYDPMSNSLDLERYPKQDPRRPLSATPLSASSVMVKRARIPVPAVGMERAQDQPQSLGLPPEYVPSYPSHIVCRMSVPYTGDAGTDVSDSHRGLASPRPSRVGHRIRMGPEQKRRSRSADGPGSPRPVRLFEGPRGKAEGMGSAPASPHSQTARLGLRRADTIDGAELLSPSSPLVKCPKEAAVTNSRVLRAERDTQLKATQHNDGQPGQPEREAQATPDLLKGQQELSEQPDENAAKLVLFSYFKEGSSESDNITRRKVDMIFEKIHLLKAWASENVKEIPFSDSMVEVKELQEKRAALESQVAELKRQLEDEVKCSQSATEARECTEAEVRRLQEELSRSEQEIVNVRQKLTDLEKELQASLEQLLQAKREREQCRADMKDLQSQLSDMHDELDHAKSNEAGERENMLQEMVKLRQDFQELQQVQEEQEEVLRWRERELTALRGVLDEEVTAQAKAVEELREQHQQEVQTLLKATEEARKGMTALGQEKFMVETEREASNAQIRELNQAKELLSTQVQTLESRISTLNRIIQDAKSHESQLQEKMDQLMEEKEQLLQELAEVRQQEEDMCRTNQALTIHLEDTQSELTKLNHAHRNLRERLREESAHVEELRRQKTELEKERRQQDKVMEELQEEMTGMVLESERATERLQVQVDQAQEQSLRELAGLRSQLLEKTEELEKSALSGQTLQTELSQLVTELRQSEQELEQVEMKCKQLEKKLEELQEKNRFTEEDKDKHVKLMEERISQLEQDLAEEQSSGDALMQRVERGREQVEQGRAELLQERAARQDLECDKISLERQTKDLKSRVAHLETSQRSTQEGLVSKLEGRIQELEERLLGEERENNTLQQANRKLERKVKEMMMQVDEEQLSLQNQRDQLTLRLKALKRQLDEAEEEIERLEHSKKKLQRELEDQQENNEQLQSQLTALRTDMRRNNKRAHLRSQDEEEDEEAEVSSG